MTNRELLQKHLYMPQIIGKDGKMYCPLPRIYDELKENTSQCAIADVLDSEMFRYGFSDLAH
jgi:hypothetical protein